MKFLLEKIFGEKSTFSHKLTEYHPTEIGHLFKKSEVNLSRDEMSIDNIYQSL